MIGAVIGRPLLQALLVVVLLRALCPISDQSFRRGWSLAGYRLEFLAARIVVRNKEVLNFAY